MRLQDKVVIITGAGRNIGEATAYLCAKEGARVVIVDNDQGRAARVADNINKETPNVAMTKAVDVSSTSAVKKMVDEIVSEWGGVDVLVNNVAISDHSTIVDLTEEEWDRVIAVSLKSVFNCGQAVSRQMIQQGRGGCIVNLGSTSGHRGRSNATAYTAAKAGILNLTRSMAIQLSQYKIRVNSVTPNRVGSPVGMDEERTDSDVSNLIGRHGVPSDVAKAIVFMISDDASFITAADLLVDGGAFAMSEP